MASAAEATITDIIRSPAITGPSSSRTTSQ